MSIGKVSTVQVSLTQVSMSVPEVEPKMDLRFIPLLEGSLQIDNQEDCNTLENIRASRINVAGFPL